MKLKVPFYKQDSDYTCGPTSLQMVFQFLGKFKSEATLAKEAQTDAEDGTTHAGMIDAARKGGFYCYANNESSVEEIKSFLKNGLPAIVHFNEPSSDTGHYSVIVGAEKGNFILNDPWNGRNFKIDENDFLKRWYGAEHKNIHKKWIMVLSKDDFNLGKQYLPKN